MAQLLALKNHQIRQRPHPPNSQHNPHLPLHHPRQTRLLLHLHLQSPSPEIQTSATIGRGAHRNGNPTQKALQPTTASANSAQTTQRQSYWIRANAAPFTQCATGTIDKQDCISVLYNAIDQCDDGDFTFGARAQGAGCVQYTLDISDVVSEGEPPWHELLVHYPGIERVELRSNVEGDPTPETPCPEKSDCQMNDLQCKGEGPGFSMEDADQAIEELCRLGGEHDIDKSGRRNDVEVSSFFSPDSYLDTKWCM
jgi:hypothetical protein